MKKKLQKIFPLLKTIFSITVFIIIIRIVTKQQSLDFFRLVTFPVLFTILLTGISQIFINSLIQTKLFGIYNIHYPYMEVLKRNFISSLYLMIIPGFFAPDFYFAVKYGAKEKKYEKIITSLFLNRIIGLLLFLILAIGGFFFVSEEILDSLSIEFTIKTSTIVLTITISILITLFVLIIFKERLAGYKRKLLYFLGEIKSNKFSFFKVILLKSGFLFIGVIGRIIIAILIGIDMNVWNLACVIIVVSLLISLPISLNGIGVREAGYVGLLTMLGITSNKALSFALFEFGIVLSVFLIGTFFWIYEKVVLRYINGTDIGD